VSVACATPKCPETRVFVVALEQRHVLDFSEAANSVTSGRTTHLWCARSCGDVGGLRAAKLGCLSRCGRVAFGRTWRQSVGKTASGNHTGEPTT
jgi:hypothetical protein